MERCDASYAAKSEPRLNFKQKKYFALFNSFSVSEIDSEGLRNSRNNSTTEAIKKFIFILLCYYRKA